VLNAWTNMVSMAPERPNITMPNQPAPDQRRIAIKIPTEMKEELRSHVSSRRSTESSLSVYFREALFRAKDDIQKMQKTQNHNHITVSMKPCKGFSTISFFCHKNDKEYVIKHSNKCGITLTIIIRHYLEEIVKEIKNFGQPYIHHQDNRY
jgi:hypothetical protein